MKTADNSKLHILLVDDSPEDRRVFKRMITQSMDQEVVFSETDMGEEGLAMCLSEKPDCVLLDFQLPDLDGLEFLAELTDVKESLPIPVVMLTGKGDEELAVAAMQGGAVDYLVKDRVTPDLLLKTIVNSIERKQAAEAIREHEEKYRKLFELSSDALFLIEIETGQILDLNNTALEMYGYSREEALQMKNTDFSAEPDKTHRATVESESLIPVRYHRKKDGTVFPVEISVCYYTLHEKEVCVAAIRDITYRIQMEEKNESLISMLRAIRNINQLIVREKDQNALIRSACNLLIEDRVYSHAWISLLDPSGRPGAFAEAGLGESSEPIQAFLRKGELPPCCQQAMERQEAVLIEDRAAICIPCLLSQKDTASCGVAVELAHEGKKFGALVLAMPVVFECAEDELSLIQEVASDIGLALHGIEQNETRLKAEQERDRILNVSQDLICIAGTDGYFKYLNPAWEKSLGYPLKELYSRSFRDFIHPDDHGKNDDEVASLSSGKPSVDFENRYVTREGEIRYISWTTTSLPEEGLMFCIGRDITERRQAEDSLIKSEEKYRTLIGNMSGMVYRGKQDWSTEIISNSEGLCGYTLDEFSSGTVNWLELTHPDDKQRVFEEGAKLTEKPNSIIQEYRILTKDGRTLWINDHKTSFFKEDGSFGGVDGIVYDVTDRKKIEYELQIHRDNLEELVIKKTREVQNNEKRLSLATRSANIGIWDWDVKQDIMAWDDQMYALYGIKEENFIGVYEAWTKGLHPDDRDMSEKEVQAALEVQKDFNTEFRVVWPDGTIHHIEAHANVYRDDNGEPIRMIGVNWDITEEKQIAESLIKAKETAEAATQIKSTFLANMSHEIRTPMNAVLGFLELVLEDTSLTDLQRQHLATAHISAQSLLGLINDILDVSKLESGKMTIEQRPFNLSDLVQEIYETMVVKAQKKGLTLQLEIQPSISGSYFGDPLRIRQIIINLVDNAIKFTEKGSVSIRIMPAEEEGQLHFMIEDTGIGISADWLSKIFESFTQVGTFAMCQFGGTGLGTTISRELVQLMGGRIWAKSEEGKGSTFHFTINITPTDQVPTEGDLFIVPGKAVLPSAQRRFRILLAEDVEANVDLAKIRLEQQGHEVTVAWNGLEAVEAFQQEEIDVILMDIHMPVMSGLEATERIRAIETDTGGHVPIIALTASMMREETEKYLEKGMDAVVAKPINFGKLFKTMEDVVPEGVGEPATEDTKDVSTKVPDLKSEKPLPETLPGIDLKDGLKRVWGNRWFFRELLVKFFDSQENTVEEIRSALESGDREKAVLLAHSLRGLAGNISAHELQASAADLETAIRTEKAELKGLLERVSAALKPVLSGIASLKEHEPDDRAADVEAMEAVDIARVAPFLDELSALLKKKDMQSRNIFKEIKDDLKKMQPDKSRRIEQYLSDLNFKGALKELEDIIDSQKSRG